MFENNNLILVYICVRSGVYYAWEYMNRFLNKNHLELMLFFQSSTTKNIYFKLPQLWGAK